MQYSSEENSSMDWEQVLCINDIHEAYNIFSDTLLCIYNNTIPVSKVITRTQNKKPWLTRGLIVSIKSKNKLYSKYLTNKDNMSHSTYKKYKNKLNHLLRIAERNHYKILLDKTKTNLKIPVKYCIVSLIERTNLLQTSHSNITIEI